MVKRTLLLPLLAAGVAAIGFAQMTIGAGYQRHDVTLNEESLGRTYVTEIGYDLVTLLVGTRLTGGDLFGVHVTASQSVPLNAAYRFSAYESGSLVSKEISDYVLGDFLLPPLVVQAGLTAGFDTGDEGAISAFAGVGPFVGYRLIAPSDLDATFLPFYVPFGAQAIGRVGVWLSDGFGLAVEGRLQWGLVDGFLWTIDVPPIHDSWIWSVGLVGMTR
jgi:hypothetical protein